MTAPDAATTAPAEARKDASTDGWLPLFNGRSLSGWKGDARYWRVVDGAIVGRIETQIVNGTFLISEEQYGDFELRLKFKLVKGNSGVQFRSVAHPRFVVSGHQADIVYGDFSWMGCLGGEKLSPARIAMTTETQKQMLRQIVRQNDWNDMLLIADGSSVKIEVNGFATVDTTVPNIPTTGVIAFQLQGRGATTVMFKDVDVRLLNKAGPSNRGSNELQGEPPNGIQKKYDRIIPSRRRDQIRPKRQLGLSPNQSRRWEDIHYSY